MLGDSGDLLLRRLRLPAPHRFVTLEPRAGEQPDVRWDDLSQLKIDDVAQHQFDDVDGDRVAARMRPMITASLR